jgi:hypothetical protein
MTEQYINKCLWSHYSASDYKLCNTFVFDFESDFICISKSGYVIECEVKVSRSDFFHDFKKKNYHNKKHDLLQEKSKIYKPNKFFFATPKGMLKNEEIPNYAGLIEIENGDVYFTKQAPFLHKEALLHKLNFVRSLMDKFYWRTNNLRYQLEIHEADIKYNQKRIEFY